MNLYIFNKKSKAAVFGIGTYIRELAAALRNSQINVCVVNINSDKPQIKKEEIEGILYWHIPASVTEQRTIKNQKQFDLYHRNIVYLLQLHILEKKDLIFHLNYMDSKPLADWLKSVFDCKIVLAVHYLDSIITLLGNINRLRRIISQPYNLTNEEEIFVKEAFLNEQAMFNAVDKIICLSNHAFDLLHRDYRIDPKKLTVIPNGLDDSNIASETGKDVLRKKWHLSEKEPVMLFVGRLHSVKGIMFLLRAFRKVLGRIPDCRLLIAGSGNYEVYLQEIKEISTKITFTGLLERKDLFELYQIADLGVIPSLYEPFGLVALEMMMCELPIVATSTSGLKEVVDEKTGLIIPIIMSYDKVEIDTVLLSEKIIYLLLHPKERERMGANARRRYDTIYSAEIFRKNMTGLYQSLFY